MKSSSWVNLEDASASHFLVSRKGNAIHVHARLNLTLIPPRRTEQVAPWALRAAVLQALFPYHSVVRHQLFHVDARFLQRFLMATIDGLGNAIDRDGEVQIEANDIGEWEFVAKFTRPVPSNALSLFSPRGLRHFLALAAVYDLARLPNITAQDLLRAMGMQSVKKGRSHGYRKGDVIYAKRFLDAMRSFRGFHGDGIADDLPWRISRDGARYGVGADKRTRSWVRLPADMVRMDHGKRRGLITTGLIAASGLAAQEKPLTKPISWWLRMSRHEGKTSHGIRPIQQLESDLNELVRQGIILSWECPESMPPLDSPKPRDCGIMVRRARWMASSKAGNKSPELHSGPRIPMKELKHMLLTQFGTLSQAANALGLTKAQLYKTTDTGLILERLQVIDGFCRITHQ